MADDNGKKARSWIPWSIAALAVGINLYFSAVGYGQDKEKIADTSFKFTKHCEKQEIKEEKMDTALDAVLISNAVTQSQNSMVLEALTALRKDMKDAEARSWMREK